MVSIKRDADVVAIYISISLHFGERVDMFYTLVCFLSIVQSIQKW